MSGLNHLKYYFIGAINNNCAYALWRHPRQNKFQLVISNKWQYLKQNELSDKNGFCLVPFEVEKHPMVLIPQDFYCSIDTEASNVKGKLPFEVFNNEYSDTVQSISNLRSFVSNLADSGKSLFENSVKQAIYNIENGVFRKVVLARREKIDFTFDVEILFSVFQDLCAHTDAYVSLVYVPEIGLYIGASPELLVKGNLDEFQTVALAGTQKYINEIDLNLASWTQKEIEEQALVSRYIIDCFKSIRLREYEDIGPKTVKAGNLLHLKTEFFVDMKTVALPDLPFTMLQLLHPTSAICGMPKGPSLEFIKANEGFDREYFSGYLGNVNVEGETDIYVNIRCAQIFQNNIMFYAGAGITEDSKPEKEFIETENKISFLKSYFENTIGGLN